MGSRAERCARNEHTFRTVNETISNLGARWGTDTFELVCECSRAGCADRFQINRDEYEEVRASGVRFAIVAGHEEPDVERVVDRRARFVVIEKIGEGAVVAQALDPRDERRA